MVDVYSVFIRYPPVRQRASPAPARPAIPGRPAEAVPDRAEPLRPEAPPR